MTALPAPIGRPPKVSPTAEQSASDDDLLIERFVKFRRVKGWTQDAAAARMGMSVNSLRAYERKSRTPNGPGHPKTSFAHGGFEVITDRRAI